MTYTLHTDGGARGNPGPAAIGVVLKNGDDLLDSIAKTIGSTTNNQAEYQALVAGLELALQHKITELDVFADSELIIKQVRGEYKVKNTELRPWNLRAQALIAEIGTVRCHVVRREKNTEADALVNKALDDAA